MNAATFACHEDANGNKSILVYPRGTAEGSRSFRVSRETLAPYFHRPQQEVADKLGVSCTTLKKICRKLGIERWPNVSRPSRSNRANSPSKRSLHGASARGAAATTERDDPSEAQSTRSMFATGSAGVGMPASAAAGVEGRTSSIGSAASFESVQQGSEADTLEESPDVKQAHRDPEETAASRREATSSSLLASTIDDAVLALHGHTTTSYTSPGFAPASSRSIGHGWTADEFFRSDPLEVWSELVDSSHRDDGMASGSSLAAQGGAAGPASEKDDQAGPAKRLPFS
mmetsp:Transcript_50101/g.99972  ORF Transcript_50101/g.99972 Transcript_50101/m.99972 type:complete len:287 (+) Transcript_50101:93-953(+)